MLKQKVKYRLTIINTRNIEKWLENQTKNGLVPIEYKKSTFVFEEKKKKQRKYFVYVSPMLEKNDAFLNELYFLKSLYGNGKTITVSSMLLAEIIEIDLSKIDDNFKWFLIARNTHYLKYFSKMLILNLIFTIGFSISSFFYPFMLCFVIWFAIGILCCILSLNALKRQRQDDRDTYGV